MNTTIQIEMVTMECSSCGMQYTLTKGFHRKKKEDGSNWNCPNGHSQCYSKSELSKALEKNQKLEERVKFLEEDNEHWINSYFTMERTARTYKGHFTRLKNKYEPTKIES